MGETIRIDRVRDLEEREYRERLAKYRSIDGGPIWREAWRREASHNASHREYRPDVLLIGSDWKSLCGEKVFGDYVGLEVDLTPKPGGDSLVDFRIQLMAGNFEIDVKTASLAYNLLVETHKIKPLTIYVLCQFVFFLPGAQNYDPRDTARMLGWQWGKVLMKSEPRTFGGHRLLNYHQRAGEIRKMKELRDHLWKRNAPTAVSGC